MAKNQRNAQATNNPEKRGGYSSSTKPVAHLRPPPPGPAPGPAPGVKRPKVMSSIEIDKNSWGYPTRMTVATGEYEVVCEVKTHDERRFKAVVFCGRPVEVDEMAMHGVFPDVKNARAWPEYTHSEIDKMRTTARAGLLAAFENSSFTYNNILTLAYSPMAGCSVCFCSPGFVLGHRYGMPTFTTDDDRSYRIARIWVIDRKKETP